MIHSLAIKGNTEPHKEDPKTSTVFENLLLFPDDDFWEILRSAIQDNKGLPLEIGELSDYQFWPKWEADNTTNSRYVEPDLFLEFENLDVIIESKRFDNSTQLYTEWNNEIVAYFNMSHHKKKKVVLIAVGGNSNLNRVNINLDDHKKITVYKCSWSSLLTSVKQWEFSHEGDIPNNEKRLIDNIEMGFNNHYEYFYNWLETISPSKVDYKHLELFF